MTRTFLGTFLRSDETTQKVDIERARRDLVRLLKAGRGNFAGSTRDSITQVNNVAKTGNYEMLLTVQRCLNESNSVLEIIRTANEMKRLGYVGGQGLLTQDTLAARAEVFAAIIESGLYGLDAKRLGAMVIAYPQRKKLVLSAIEGREYRLYSEVVAVVESAEQQAA